MWSERWYLECSACRCAIENCNYESLVVVGRLEVGSAICS